MSDYRIICTALPHGRYESGRSRLTVLINLQYIGAAATQLGSLSLYRNWTSNLKALLERTDPAKKRSVEIKFRRLDAAGLPTVDLFPPINVPLPATQLIPSLWTDLFSGVIPVSCAKCQPPGALEFQSYSHAAIAKDLDKKTVELALNSQGSPTPAFDLGNGEYPAFPGQSDLANTYEIVSPFVKPGAIQQLSQQNLLGRALQAAGPFRSKVDRDVARLQRLDPSADLKDVAYTAIVNIHGGGDFERSSIPAAKRAGLPTESLADSLIRAEYIKALLYHRPMPKDDHGHFLHTIEPPRVLDFNQRLSMLGNHPATLRPLGSRV